MRDCFNQKVPELSCPFIAYILIVALSLGKNFPLYYVLRCILMSMPLKLQHSGNYLLSSDVSVLLPSCKLVIIIIAFVDYYSVSN